MNEDQIHKYATSLSEQYGVDLGETARLLTLLSEVKGHDVVLTAFATSLINQGVEVRTLIKAMAQVNLVVSQRLASRES
jgi:hypothetical protein